MYPVSEAYKNWIYNNNSHEGRIFDISGYIDAPFGRVDIDPADLVAGSVKYEDATISSDSLEVGSVFSAGLSFSVYNNKSEYSDISFNGCEASFSVGYKLESGVFEWVPLGQFIIIESSVPANTISFRALDKMILLSSVKWADINVMFPATVREIANACFSAAALPPLPADSFLHDDYVVDAAFTDDSFTARDIVSYCAQIAGCYAKIDRNGTPKFGWYGDIRTPVYYSLNANSDEITGLSIEDGALKVLSGGYEEQDESFYSIGLDDRIDFRVSGSTIYVTGILYEHGEESRLYGRREYLIVLEDNPLVQENMDAVMSAIYEKIGRFAYIPYESKIFGDPAREAGDLVTILHKDGTEYHTIITNISYTFRGESSIEARGKPREINNVQGFTSKAISHVAKEQKIQSVAIETATNLIANMLGGYAIKEDNAYYVADHPDLNQAVNVWKWGIGGFGYSTNGVEGPYETTITADGSIVAKLIEAGIVLADYIKAGMLESQNGASWLNMNDGKFSFGNGNLVWNGTALSVNGNVTVTGGTIDGSKANITNINAGNIKTGVLTVGGSGHVGSIVVLNGSGNAMATINTSGIQVAGTIGATGFTGLYGAYGVSARFDLVPHQPGFMVQLSGMYTDDYNPILFSAYHIRGSYATKGTTYWNTDASSLNIFNSKIVLSPSRIDFALPAYTSGGALVTSGAKYKENIKLIKSKAIENTKQVKNKEQKNNSEEQSADDVCIEDFIDLLDRIADNECIFNYKPTNESGEIQSELVQLGVIADGLSDHKAYQYIGVKNLEDDGSYEHALKVMPIAMLSIVGYGHLRDQNKAQEQRINDLEARIARLEKLIGGTK